MILSEEEILSKLKQLNMIIPVKYVDAVDSTNTLAKNLRASNGENLLVVAGRQTAGKGRNGRSFESRFGGAYFSFTFTPIAGMTGTQLCGSVMLAALAVRSVMEDYGVKCSIKWPNDVLCKGRKLCGILSEVVYDRDYPDFMVIGIGINVNNPLDELSDIAISMKEEKGKDFDVAEIIAAVVRRFFEMLTDEDFSMMKEYRKHCITLGQNVKVVTPSGEYYAFAQDVDDKGFLIVRTTEGKTQAVSCGDVSIRAVLS